jgi:hypothetical protein
MWRSNAAAPASPIRVEMGDRAGGDIADVPRPPRSERIGSMSGQAGSANVRYVTPAAPGEVVNFYLNTMPRRGWMPRVRTRPGDVEYPGTILWYSNAKGNSCMITVSDAGGQGTAVTIIRMARTAD